MNKQIQKLAVDAGLKIESLMTNPPKPFQILGSTDQFEKFAELIVKECLKEMGISKQCDPYTGEVYTSDYNRAIDDQMSMLTDHFGVTK